MAHREGREISRRDIAAALGVDYSTVQRWETGRTEPDPDELRRIAPLLRSTVGWLANGEGEPPSPMPVSLTEAERAARNQAALDSLPVHGSEPAEQYAERVSPRRRPKQA